MSQSHSNNPNREFKSFQKSYQNWDAGTPSPDLWGDLEADLAVSAVWNRLDETLELNGSSADKVMVESYENWSPNASGNGWTKLEEQLSRERVWNRLNVSLNDPVTTRMPWLKMAAASVLFVFLSFYTDYVIESDSYQPQAVSGTSGSEQMSSNALNNRKQASVASENTIGVYHVRNATTKQDTGKTNLKNRILAQNEVNNDLNGPFAVNPNPGNVSIPNPVENHSASKATASNTVTTFDDLTALNELGRKEIAYEPTNGQIGDFTFIPSKVPFKPRFSVQFGGQFSLINEKNRSAFSSSLPSMGIAADLQYHYYIRNIRLTQDLGFSQYAQSNGSYINGHYISSNQRLNTIFLMSSVGYSYRGATIYGGISINRLLGGYEANHSMITNVYNSDKFQLGATVGIDYHIVPFKNKTALGVGMQYQFVSRLKSGNAVFNDIQGIKLQIKYSF
ncbi:hypothetical protein [Fluviicola sp.]|jgi:hypothetical protein|uniref:hypothetical protein n=1 Tax=Fluviicola sp. TaxID=1917219 RepID=UPI00281C8619|nr:hypothetical protein [Fluviicola sp.]MDR0801533.1 hypothetical protein [Fluviicola sp.]